MPYLLEPVRKLLDARVHRAEFHKFVVAYKNPAARIQDIKVPSTNQRDLHEVRKVNNFVAQKYLSGRFFNSPKFAVTLT
ncbi:MAG: hypothetical protein ABSC71_01575 [Candidatus Acidiferrales bacterium]